MTVKTSCCILICFFSISILIDCKKIIENNISDESNSSEYDEKNINKEVIKSENKLNNSYFPLRSFSDRSKKYMIKNGGLDTNGKTEAASAKRDIILRKQILNALKESKQLWDEKHKLTQKIKSFNQEVQNMQMLNNIKPSHLKVTTNSKEEMGFFANERKYIPFSRIPSINRESLKDLEDETKSIVNSDLNNKQAEEFSSDDNAETQQSDENISSDEDTEKVSVKKNENIIKQNVPDSLTDDVEETEENSEVQTESKHIISPANSLRTSKPKNQHKLRMAEKYLERTPCATVKMLAQSYNDEAPTNSTIEVSDTEYQDNNADEESDDEYTFVNYPYTVSIQRKGAHYTSGALVGTRWVLSTAAEFFNVRETIKLFKIRIGSVNCKKGGVVISLKSITIHPEYMTLKTSYDLSVLSMAEPVYSDVIKPIAMSNVAGNILTASFLTTYWPRIVIDKGVVPPTAKERIKFNSMRVSSQKLIPSDKCSKMLATVNITLTNTSLCLKPIKTHHSDCMPDVGAPVVALDGLWGITSGWVSPLCLMKPFPTLVTRISAPDIRTWIEKQMSL